MTTTKKTLTPSQLVRFASLLYGRRWKNDLAEASDISREQLWRYATEVTPISDEVSDNLRNTMRKAFEKKRDQFDAALKTI